MTTGGSHYDLGSRLALYYRVVEALERSAELAERHAQRECSTGTHTMRHTIGNAPAALARSLPELARSTHDCSVRFIEAFIGHQAR
jgi:hypothetical protein